MNFYNYKFMSNLENLATHWYNYTHYLIGDLVKKDNIIYYCKKEHVSNEEFMYDLECHDYWERVTWINSLNEPIIVKERKNNEIITKDKPTKKKINRKVFLFNEK